MDQQNPDSLRLSPAVSWKVKRRKVIVAWDSCLVFDNLGSNLKAVTDLLERLSSPGGVLTADLDSLNSEPRAVAAKLKQLGLLVPVDPPEEFDESISHELEWFAAQGVSPRVTAERLEKATIGIVGLGGIGCHVLQQFVMAGIKQFILIDHDAVELNNLNRQPLYSVSDVGTFKVLAAERFLKGRFPGFTAQTSTARIHGVNSVMRVPPLQNADLVVASADAPLLEIEESMLEFSAKSNVPVAFGSCGLNRGYCGPIVRGREAEELLRAKRDDLANFVKTHGVVPGITAARASLGPTNSVVASFLALDCLLFLVGRCVAPFPARTIDFLSPPDHGT